jgi:hypothetical protein
MRHHLRVLLLPALLLPAVSMADEAAKTEAAPVHHPRMTREQHFAKANTAADGHLTLDEAKSGYPLVAKHFHDIDVDGKGYVTVQDIQTWNAMRKVARSLRSVPDDAAKPQNARQSTFPEVRPVGMPSATQVSAQQ